jgi:rSAM/selenodomain-associated transferase 2
MIDRISIIMPVLNEQANIQSAIASILTGTNIETIVVDGGSTDDTCKLARAQGVTVLASTAGRAHQMNLGAKAATGDILVFLHGDTRLPAGFDTLIRAALSTNKEQIPIAGAFALKIDAPQDRLRWVEIGANWRSRWLQMPYGDQAIFLRATVFAAIGGFPELPIMEDFELIQRLKRRGSIVIIPTPVITSARRWLEKGIFKTTLINQSIVLGYLLGFSPERLKQLYRRAKKKVTRKHPRH